MGYSEISSCAVNLSCRNISVFMEIYLTVFSISLVLCFFPQTCTSVFFHKLVRLCNTLSVSRLHPSVCFCCLPVFSF